MGRLDEAHDHLMRYWHWALPTGLPQRLAQAVIEGAVPTPPATPAAAATTTARRSAHIYAPSSATERAPTRSRCGTGDTPSAPSAAPHPAPPPPARDTSPHPLITLHQQVTGPLLTPDRTN
ncbi:MULTISPECIES: hypothetical protein [Streptomyces]|uniref:hypothetical protein n=1 Tax=Streptomyces TaxID=1883 RepID=UPI001F2F5BDF|nr:hypothetical protein [Streptomyces noursei]MCE4946593.1 hypothetical protein [Streptomyces noursei]